MTSVLMHNAALVNQISEGLQSMADACCQIAKTEHQVGRLVLVSNS